MCDSTSCTVHPGSPLGLFHRVSSRSAAHAGQPAPRRDEGVDGGGRDARWPAGVRRGGVHRRSLAPSGSAPGSGPTARRRHLHSRSMNGAGASRSPRIGILVVAYNAESTLAATLDRIPGDFLARVDEIIVADDASGDDTFGAGRALELVEPGGADHRHPPPREPRLRRQPEGRLPHGDRTRARHRGDAPRRRPVRARSACPTSCAPIVDGRRRRGVRVAHDRAGRGAPRRDAALQVRRQQDPDAGRELAARHRPVRVPLRVPGLLGRRAGGDPVRGEHRRLRLRHPDHRAAGRRRQAHRRGPDPHLLRRRDLLRRRREVRQGRRARRRAVPHVEARIRHRPLGPARARATASSPTTTRRTRRSSKLIRPIRPGQKILDVGCSSGLLAEQVRQPRPPRDRRRRGRGARRPRSGRRLPRSGTSTVASPSSAARSTSSSPPTSSSTSASRPSSSGR